MRITGRWVPVLGGASALFSCLFLNAALTFTAVAGADYAIAVDGALGTAGDFTLALDLTGFTQPPPRMSFEIAESNMGRLRVAGLAGQPAAVQATLDFRSWDLLQIAPAGPDDLELLVPLVGSARFYRTVIVPLPSPPGPGAR